MKQSWKNFFAGGLTLCSLAAMAAEVNQERLAELLTMLDLNRPELAEVKAATTPEAQTAALVKHFTNRPADVKYRRKKMTTRAKDRTEADAALEHRFPGQPSYGLVPRGTPIDWDDPYVKDVEWILQFHRLNWWESLGVRYRETKDERYAKEWAEESNSWIDHMFRPEKSKHRGWRSLETAGRISRFGSALRNFGDSPAMDGRTLVNLLWAMEKHAAKLEKMLDAVPVKRIHNFEVMEQNHLLRYVLAFPEMKRNTSRIREGVDRLCYIQSIVVLPDGVIAEFVPSYHTGYPDIFWSVRKTCQKEGLKVEFPAEYDQRIQKGVTAVMLWSHPDGRYPLFGDAFEQRAGFCRGYVRKFCADYPERQDWLWFATKGEQGKAPAELVHCLPSSGYVTMRSDWSAAPAVFLVAKNSLDPDRQWHNQPDNMTFELSFNGKRVMVDTGCFVYSGDQKAREWFAASARHQTVTLDGKNNERAGKLLFQKEAEGVLVTALKNEAQKDLTHQRIIFLVAKKYVTVLDLLSGPAAGELRCHYQLLEGEHQFDPAKWTASNKDLTLTGAPSNGKMEEEEGKISWNYKKSEPRPAFAFVQKKEKGKPAEFLALITPAGADKGFTPSIRFESGMFRSSMGSFVMEPVKGEKYRVTYDLKAKQVSCRKF